MRTFFNDHLIVETGDITLAQLFLSGKSLRNRLAANE